MRLGQRRRELSQRDEGFTLVELVVSMVIIGIVMVSLITVQVRTLQTNATSAARVTATSLANAAMEEFRAMPWNVVRKGMASNFLAASGGDTLVTGGFLKVGSDTYQKITVAPAGPSDQNLAVPASPLFDTNGSNARTVDDPEGNGNIYVVKGYVTKNSAGVIGAVGLAVVVEWHRPGAPINHTVVLSTAYAPGGGCGNLDVAPFLTSCQPTYRASANTASMSASVEAYAYDAATDTIGDMRSVVPDGSDSSIRSSSTQAHASVQSAQTSTATGSVSFPLSSVSPMSVTGTEQFHDGGSLVKIASNNTVDPNAPPAHGGLQTSTSTVSSALSVFGTGASVSVIGDDGRSGTVTASTTTSCPIPGGAYVPAGQPCGLGITRGLGSSVPLKAKWSFDTSVGSQSVDLVTMASSVTGDSSAWAGRFVKGGSTGSAATGCTALSGAGCVSAGTSSKLPVVTIGKFSVGSWDGGAASNGLVTVTGYSDNVMVQRGGAQQTNAATMTRTAVVKYWNGSGYSTINVTSATSNSWSSNPVTWTSADLKVTAQATVSVTAPSTRVFGTDCSVDRCRVVADAGLIAVTIQLTVVPAVGDPYVLQGGGFVSGGNVLAQYTEPPIV